MELSVLPRPQLESAPPDERCRAASAATLELFDVPVPADLRQLGATVRASALGDPTNPPVVVLGGISANRFPAVRPDGSPGWWWGLAGEGSAIDPAHYCIIGMDFAADESGKIAPSTFDQARVLAAVLDAIGIDRPVTIVGASYGGMVGLALAEIEPAADRPPRGYRRRRRAAPSCAPPRASFSGVSSRSASKPAAARRRSPSPAEWRCSPTARRRNSRCASMAASTRLSRSPARSRAAICARGARRFFR